MQNNYKNKENAHQNDFNLSLQTINEAGFFSGYASVFNVLDNHSDIILKGAFAKSILKKKLKDIKLLWQHKVDEPIGYFTLIKENEEGLYVEGRLLINDLQRAKEAYVLLKNGAIDGLSIGYSVKESHFDTNKNARIIKSLELFEISLVTFPANESAGVTHIKNSVPQTLREFEQFLRDAGFSKKSATSIALFGFKETKRDAFVFDEGEDLTRLENAINRAIKALTI